MVKEDLVKLTLKELRVKLVKLGMPEDDAEAFETKKPAIAAINTIRAKTLVESPGQLKKDKEEYLSKKETMRKLLMAQPQIRILVPCEGAEQPGVVKWVTNKVNGKKEQKYISGSVLPVQLNGFKWLVAKGVYQEVPQQIADTVSAAQNMTSEAGKPFLTDRVDPKTGKKISEML